MMTEIDFYKIATEVAKRRFLKERRIHLERKNF